MAEQDLELVVTDVKTEAQNVVSLSLSTADGQPLPAWEPGAHIDVRVGDDYIRQYSLCGDTADSSSWRIGVLREREGRGASEFIHQNVRAGDTLRVRGPRNNFEVTDAERYLFIAGGIGITPMLQMIRHVAAEGRPWTLLYGGRSRSAMAFLGELESVDGGKLVVYPEDEVGRPDLEGYLGTPEDNTSVYCCGPGPLLDVVEGLCLEWPSGALQVERFAPSARLITAGEAFDVEVQGSGERVHVPVYLTMLEALEDAGLQIESSCRAGICGTCLVYVKEGVPEHNDDVLSDEVRDSNTCMLPCVSRSMTASLSIELIPDAE